MSKKARRDNRRSDGFAHHAFRVSLVIKGIDGFLEFLGGILFLFITPSTINATLRFLTRRELFENARDLVTHSLTHLAHQLSLDTKLLVSAYLLAHGIIKIVLVIGLLGEHEGVYPYAFGFLILFIVIESVRLIDRFSIGIFILMLFDLFVLLMVFLEYRKLS